MGARASILGSSCWCGPNREFSSDCTQSFLHADEPKAYRDLCLLEIHSCSIVGHSEQQLPRATDKFDANIASLAVFGNVFQRFVQNAEEAECDIVSDLLGEHVGACILHGNSVFDSRIAGKGPGWCHVALEYGHRCRVLLLRSRSPAFENHQAEASAIQAHKVFLFEELAIWPL